MEFLDQETDFQKFISFLEENHVPLSERNKIVGETPEERFKSLENYLLGVTAAGIFMKPDQLGLLCQSVFEYEQIYFPLEEGSGEEYSLKLMVTNILKGLFDSDSNYTFQRKYEINVQVYNIKSRIEGSFAKNDFKFLRMAIMEFVRLILKIGGKSVFLEIINKSDKALRYIGLEALVVDP